MKTFESTYTKEFKAETEDALYIARLKQPKGTKLIQVQEGKSLHDIIGDICNPKNNYYWCNHCNKDINILKVEWKNNVPLCPECLNELNL